MSSDKESIIKKKSSLIWIVIFVSLLIVNFLPFYLIIIQLFGSPPFFLLTIIFADFIWLLVAFAIIDLITILFYVIKERPHGVAKVLSYSSVAFPVLLFYFIYLGSVEILDSIPILISREQAIKQINTCNVATLNRYSGQNRIIFEAGEYATDEFKIYIIETSDFDMLVESARSLHDRCGYEFGVFDGYVGFQKVDHPIYITVDEAARLLKSCTIKEVFYRTTEDNMPVAYNFETPTGIALWSKEKPTYIYVRRDLETETLPIFREAQKACPDSEIY